MTTSAEPTARYIKALVFRMGEQEYCVDILRVREIRGWTPATPLPHGPHFLRGVVNLRGVVLPVIDFSALLNCRPLEPNSRSAIIVLEYGGCLFGLLVDGVSDVLDIELDVIQPTPEIASTSEQFVTGIVALEKRMISVVSLEHLATHGKREAA
ncbi:MAG: chemotaxis protein CheW [Hyphomicrobium sp.]